MALGPVSTHLSLAAGFGQLMASPLSPLSQPQHFLSASLVITFASLAGIVFRQGNSQGEFWEKLRKLGEKMVF